MDSLWTKTARMPRFAPLRRDLKTDVLVVGGGMAGLLCAYWLTRAGVDCALVEADRLCGGVTQNTTAKITAQHGLMYDRLLRALGPEGARLYLAANQEALDRYRTLCRSIDCGFEERDSFVYAREDRRKLDRELAALDRLGAPASFAAELPLPFPTAGAVRFPRQAQFHPLQFAAAIARDLRIFEHTRVLSLAPGRAVTTGGTVSAEKIIVATHFPMVNRRGAYFLKLYQHRSYVLALENAPEVRGMYVDEDPRGLSLRGAQGQLLLGGGGHRTGKESGGWRPLEDFAARHFPEARETARWAAQDCMSLDGVPYAGRYAKSTPWLYVTAGFNKWGMTSAMAAALVLTDLVRGRESPYAGLFSPARSMLRPQLAANLGESLWGMLRPTVPRCPHMGCALRWNRAERSWDCPCHGSRFSGRGALLDNPAAHGKALEPPPEGSAEEGRAEGRS